MDAGVVFGVDARVVFAGVVFVVGAGVAFGVDAGVVFGVVDVRVNVVVQGCLIKLSSAAALLFLLVLVHGVL